MKCLPDLMYRLRLLSRLRGVVSRITTACWLLFFSLWALPAAAQNYSFIHFGVAEGMAQSQTLAFAQNNNHLLFIGTLGGLSEFDGSSFTNYNKGNGLPHNVVYDLAVDRRQNLWIATPDGVSRFDGRRFTNYELTANERNKSDIDHVAIDGNNQVWALSSGRLYRLRGDQFMPVRKGDTTMCMTVGPNGALWIYCYGKGIYVADREGWQQKVATPDRSFVIYKMQPRRAGNEVYCLSSKGIKVTANHRLVTPAWAQHLPVHSFVHTLLEDSKGKIWLATEAGGAWSLQDTTWIHYTYANGFTNETVNLFFEDAEGNIWLGTNGAGIYRFSGSIFTYYDRNSGLFSSSITSITQNPDGRLYFSGKNSGMFQMYDGKLSPFKLPPELSKINTLLTDAKGRMWMGADFDGVWRYRDGRFRPYPLANGMPIYGVTNLAESNDHTLWISSVMGLFSISPGAPFPRKEPMPDAIYATMAVGSDTLLIGSMNGVYVFHRRSGNYEQIPYFSNATVLCFAADPNNIYIGTDDRGVVIWNRKTRKFLPVGEDAGLSCNYVYSLLIDEAGYLWVGTGCGIDRLSFTNGRLQIRNFGSSDGLGGVENNANASFEDQQGYIWFGTNRGLFKYDPLAASKKKPPVWPKIVFKSIRLFSKEIPPGKYSDSLLPFSTLPYHPIFPTDQNHLTFSFKGICLSSPDKIKYRYQLVGIDRQYTETSENTVVYPNLPSGKYVFKVWASDALGHWSDGNMKAYPFVINTPFYQTLTFKIGLVLLLTALFLGIVYFRNARIAARLRWASRVREEEQARVRQRTAEDFHDEIGNKLTRISLLTSVLESKNKDQTEDERRILKQIQKNVASLYHGAKDIIWSLQPESDRLSEIIWKIRQNTNEMVHASGIEFSYRQQEITAEDRKLPPDYSRNLIMIFKEAVNNSVKHAAAKKLLLTVRQEGDELVLTLTDDGKGFAPDAASAGNGLKNMRNRARRVNSKLTISSAPGKGTVVVVRILLPQ